MPEDTDTLIIGGGPGGSAAATVLARAGRSVLVLEKDRFPRFHIGESLLPYNRRLFAELGVLDRLEQSSFVSKSGAQFHAANGSHVAQFIFRNGSFTKETTAYQVERAPFDDLLLRNAQSAGADVREGWTTERFDRTPGGVRVTAKDPQGQSRLFDAKFLIDASGRANITGNQESLREFHPRHRKLAIYSHFQGVHRDPGERGGDTVIVRLPQKWFWLIPLGPERVSVGCVIDKDEFTRDGREAADVFHALVQSSPVMQERLDEAVPLRPLEVTTDFSYHNRRLAGDRVIRVGDAAGFMDPIFSAGVYLAMLTGTKAAKIVHAALNTGDDGAKPFARYERELRRSLQTYWRMVEAFYTQSFMELFFSPTERFRLASAVNAVLAGELDGGWRLSWRLRVFFLLVKVQSRFPLVPRADLG